MLREGIRRKADHRFSNMATMSVVNSTSGETATARPPTDDPHLRSAREVTGYAIQARDGALGHVEDFIVDDESWALRYRRSGLLLETYAACWRSNLLSSQ
jgi:hypothetical protein